MGDDFSWFGDGSDSYVTPDYGSNVSDFNASDTGSNWDWANSTGNQGQLGGDYGTGGSSSGYNWSGLAGPALGAAGSYLNNSAKSKMSKEELELKAKLERENYAFNLAEQEKYYQAHGQQLATSLGGFAKYQKPQVGLDNPTRLFGLLTPGYQPSRQYPNGR